MDPKIRYPQFSETPTCGSGRVKGLGADGFGVWGFAFQLKGSSSVCRDSRGCNIRV